MGTFALVHGGGDSGWAWHLVEAELRARGHDTVAPDLPFEDENAGIQEYAEVVVAAVGDREDVTVVGHSFGGLVAPVVATRLNAKLVYVSGMIPAPGESPNAWWQNTGYRDAVREAAELDGGLTGNEDPYVLFFHDVPKDLADEAIRRERGGSSTRMDLPWPLDALPDVPTRFVLCTGDRFFPAAFFRRLVAERLGVRPEEIQAGHCVPLSRPAELAALLTR
jgi:pimeloyl-ACP methyl ester carboxylesterase